MSLASYIRSSPKLYALLRMRMAIDRAISSPTIAGSNKASRWAAAWGEVAGIPKPVRKPIAANAIQGITQDFPAGNRQEQSRVMSD